MLQDHQLSRKLAVHASAYPPMDTAMEFAKAAFDAGNELAALDTRFFSAGISDVPDWAALSVDPGAARHLGITDGKNSAAIAFVKSHNTHFERYAAATLALTRDRVMLAFDGIETALYARAVELLAENGIRTRIGPVRSSCALVRRDFAAGRGHHYWYPLSREILDYFPGQRLSWCSSFHPKFRDGAGWCLAYGIQ